MRIKELIEELQKYDPEMVAITRRYSDTIDMDKPEVIKVFKTSMGYSIFYPLEWKHAKENCDTPEFHCYHVNYKEEIPNLIEALYFRGN